MNASRSWKTPSPASPSTSKGQCPLAPDCAPWARRAIQVSMALWERSADDLAFPPLSSPRPPLGNGPRGSRQGVSPCIPHRARGARGYSRENGLAAELPPLGDRPRGSPVWCGFLFVGVRRPPSGDRPSGSRQGVTPCTPHRAHRARGYSRGSSLAAELLPLGYGPRGSPV